MKTRFALVAVGVAILLGLLTEPAADAGLRRRFLLLFSRPSTNAVVVPDTIESGDILGASTTNDAGQPFYATGNLVSLWFSDMATNGTIDTGIAYDSAAASATTNLSGAKVTLTATSQGFNTNGIATTRTRTIYGTKAGRIVYPNDANTNIVVSDGTNAVVSLYLSEPIYAGDTVTISAGSGLYVTADATNASYSGTVTNVSSITYPNLTGQWTRPGRERAVTTWTNAYIGFSPFAFSNSPAAKAYDIANDAHGNSVTNVATLTKRTSAGNIVIEYTSVHHATNFTQGDIVTNNFFLVPWIGTNIVTSSTLSNCSPHYILCDRSNRFDTVAVLSTSGNNSTGIATNDLAVATANPFLTTVGAIGAIRGTNNARFGRNNASASTIYCAAGSYNISPTRSGSGSGDDSWLTITPLSGVPKSSVIFTNTGGLNDGPDTTYLKLDGVTLWEKYDFSFLYNTPNIWLNNCNYIGFTNGSAGLNFYVFSSLAVTDCYITNNNDHSYFPGTPFAGNYGEGIWKMSALGGVVGNHLNSSTEAGALWGGSVPGVSEYENSIFFNNCLFKGGRPLLSIDAGSVKNISIVQNVFEKLSGSSEPIIGISTSENPGATNVFLAKNSTAGDRANLFYYYNPSGGPNASSGPSRIVGVSMRDNLFWGLANKNDQFTGGTNQFGNWPFSNGVGLSGNYFRQWTSTGNSFPLEFMGLKSVAAYVTTTNDTVHWVNDASQGGTDSGNGDYHLAGDSPVLNMSGNTWLGLPWDIEGNDRTSSDPPGAYIE